MGRRGLTAAERREFNTLADALCTPAPLPEPVTVPAALRRRGRPLGRFTLMATALAGRRQSLPGMDLDALIDRANVLINRWNSETRAACGRAKIGRARQGEAARKADRRAALREYVQDKGHLSVSNLASRLKAADVRVLAEALRWPPGVDRLAAAGELQKASHPTLRRDIAAIRRS